MADYPDFTVIARLKGEYAGAEKSVGVDAQGNLKTLLYGTYGGADKQILVDVDGNVRMNLYAQDLEEMVNRFKYGAPDFVLQTGVPALSEWVDFIDVDGMGYIYGVTFRTDGDAVATRSDICRIYLDGVFGAQQSYLNMNTWQSLDPHDHIFTLARYDTGSFVYACACAKGYTFESNCTLQYYTLRTANLVECHFFHALV